MKTIRKIVRNNSAIRQSGLNFKWHFFLFRRLKIALYPINYAEIPWVVVKSRIFNSYSNVFSYRSFAIENSTKNLFKAAYAPTWLVYRMHFKKIFLDWFLGVEYNNGALITGAALRHAKPPRLKSHSTKVCIVVCQINVAEYLFILRKKEFPSSCSFLFHMRLLNFLLIFTSI